MLDGDRLSPLLTERQRQVPQASIDDPEASYALLADRLCCSEETIRKQFKSIKKRRRDRPVRPRLEFANGGTIRFWARTTTADFPDHLEVRLSLNGDGTDVGTTATSVGDFTTNVLTINPDLLPGRENYPTDWTQFTIAPSGLPAPPTLGVSASATSSPMSG